MNPLMMVLSLIPWERVFAYVWNKIARKIEKNADKPERMQKILRVVRRGLESASVASELIEDLQKPAGELQKATADGSITDDEAITLRKAALEAWAKGKGTPAKFKAIFRKREG